MSRRPTKESGLAFLVRSGFKPGCTGKQPFTSWSEAERRARIMRNNHETGCKVEPYHCQVCGKIHLGQARVRKKHREMA